VMAPTELLAEQHLRSFVKWFEPLGVRVVWLGGKQTTRERREVLNALADGQASVAVGTHALFQDQVRFAALALAVIDEQHRFGVDQRQALLAKGPSDVDSPHQLIMTATPIPRTLAMAGCAHLDISSIDELPPGRKAVETVVVPQSRRDQLIARVASACGDGSQAYWVCPLIEESDSLQAEAAEETAAMLAESLPTVTTGLVHGRMKSAERDLVMARFRDGEIDLLVATTVIEVGVDVPNASLMVIENAERMGLSQLHQLRGRVGRGQLRSHCVLLYRGPLSRTATSRLAVMRESTDGFVISEKDLELRGPGEVLGTRQTGDIKLRVADLGRDVDLVDKAVEIAPALLKATPQAQEALVERWIGRAVDYGEVG
ncbi:MAG: ATP-dependent DNA helicase RecG, partial [Gammaproteobacteria bacterium]